MVSRTDFFFVPGVFGVSARDFCGVESAAFMGVEEIKCAASIRDFLDGISSPSCFRGVVSSFFEINLAKERVRDGDSKRGCESCGVAGSSSSRSAELRFVLNGVVAAILAIF